MYMTPPAVSFNNGLIHIFDVVNYMQAIILLMSLHFGDGKIYLNVNGKFIKKNIYVNVIRLQLSLVTRSILSCKRLSLKHSLL